MSSVLHITNNVSTSNYGTEASELQIFIANPGSYDLFGAGGAPVIDNTSGAFTYHLPGVIGAGTNSPTLIASGGVDSGAIVDSGTLVLFTGTGTVGLAANTTTLISGSHTGNELQINVTQANLQSIVTYDFNPAPAPEPSTFAMIGTGLAGLGMVFRRRSVK
jgi:hypothetical protein